jgi:hypothetical protein
MRQMRWSWRDLQNTPAYVRKYTWDFLNARARVQNDSHGHHAR